jgi:hypothetical protein
VRRYLSFCTRRLCSWAPEDKSSAEQQLFRLQDLVGKDKVEQSLVRLRPSGCQEVSVGRAQAGSAWTADSFRVSLLIGLEFLLDSSSILVSFMKKCSLLKDNQ